MFDTEQYGMIPVMEVKEIEAVNPENTPGALVDGANAPIRSTRLRRKKLNQNQWSN